MSGAVLDQQWQPGQTPSVGGPTFSSDQYECPDPQDYLDDGSEDYVGPYASPGAFLGGSRRANPLPSPGDRSGDPFGDNPPVTRGKAGRARKVVDRKAPEYTRPSGLTNHMLDDIRVQIAQGITMKDISQEEKYRHIRYSNISRVLYETGWKPWTQQEDTALLTLHNQEDYRGNWAKIRNEETFRDRRIEPELEARCGFHSRPRPHSDSIRRRNGDYSQFTPEADRYIMLAVAQRLPTMKKMVEKRFPHVGEVGLKVHARNIGATWGAKEDNFLKAEVESFPAGTPVDWDSIAAKYSPPRRGEVVKRHWEYKKTGEIRNIEQMMLEGLH